MTEYAMETKKLTKRFGHVTALDNVNLHLTRGTIYGLVGKSGAGKSTLLRVVSGLQNPSEGGYELFGKDSAGKEIRGARRRVGYVGGGWSMLPGLTLRSNVKRQCALLGVPGMERVVDVLRMTGLEDLAEVKAEKLPAEKQVIAAIAMALCGSPDLLLIDDVMAGMSLQQKAETEELLKRFRQDLGLTILVTAQDPETLDNVADQYGILEHGELKRELSSEEIKALRETALRVRVSDTNALARVMVAKSLRHRILSADTAEIYDRPHITELVTELAKEGCEVLSIEERSVQTESLLQAISGGER